MSDQWIRFNPLTQTYDTRDGTHVAAELVENVQCLADALCVAAIREEQRAQSSPTRRTTACTGGKSMSLDVWLEDEAGNGLYNANITHNLNKMAGEAGIYECLWRPDEHGITHARQVIEPLSKGLALLVTEKARFERFNAPNGWGLWKHFVPFCADYLQACREHPDALVRVSR